MDGSRLLPSQLTAGHFKRSLIVLTFSQSALNLFPNQHLAWRPKFSRGHDMRSVWGISLVGSLLLVCLRLPSLGQTITGTISGDVTDTSGAVVAGATITVENLGTSQKRTATTTASGTFIVPDLAIGRYKVTATAEGFKTLTQAAEVLTGAVTRTGFKLPVGQRTETVEVEGSAPLVDLSPNNNNYVDSEKIENVPLNGRDFNSLLAMTPGVQRD